MTVSPRPPATYQEWLEHLNYVQEHPGDRARLRLLREGALCGGGQVLERFLCRLDEAVRRALSRRIRQFLRQVDEALAGRDFDGAELLSVRFWGDVSACFFFESLPCIPEETRALFVQGFSGQLRDFWGRFLGRLRQDAAEQGGAGLEDLLFRLSRLKPLEREEDSDGRSQTDQG